MWLQSLRTHWVVGKLYMCNIRARSVLDQFQHAYKKAKSYFSKKIRSVAMVYMSYIPPPKGEMNAITHALSHPIH